MKEVGMIRAAQDVRQYGHERLANGVDVLVVSEPKEQSDGKCYAAVCVGVGGGSDPVEYPGLAHLLEHMMFRARDASSDGRVFRETISQDGGSTNAFTSLDETCYYFGVSDAKFDTSLERFARLFTSGPWPGQGQEQELRADILAELPAVDSEAALREADNARWSEAALGLLSVRRDVRLRKFICGTTQTLLGWTDIQSLAARLRAFHHEHYVAPATRKRMSVVVAGPRPLAALAELASRLFASASASTLQNAATDSWTWVPMFPEEGMEVCMTQPKAKEQRTLVATWSLPPNLSPMKSMAATAASRIIRRTDVASLRPDQRFFLSADATQPRASGLPVTCRETTLAGYLEASGYAAGGGMGVSARQNGRDGCLLTVRIALTEKGHARRGEILAAVADYARLAADTPAQTIDEIVSEYMVLSKKRFVESEPSGLGNIVAELAVRLAAGDCAAPDPVDALALCWPDMLLPTPRRARPHAERVRDVLRTVATARPAVVHIAPEYSQLAEQTGAVRGAARRGGPDPELAQRLLAPYPHMVHTRPAALPRVLPPSGLAPAALARTPDGVIAGQTSDGDSTEAKMAWQPCLVSDDDAAEEEEKEDGKWRYAVTLMTQRDAKIAVQLRELTKTKYEYMVSADEMRLYGIPAPHRAMVRDGGAVVVLSDTPRLKAYYGNYVGDRTRAGDVVRVHVQIVVPRIAEAVGDTERVFNTAISTLRSMLWRRVTRPWVSELSGLGLRDLSLSPVAGVGYQLSAAGPGHIAHYAAARALESFVTMPHVPAQVASHSALQGLLHDAVVSEMQHVSSITSRLASATRCMVAQSELRIDALAEALRAIQSPGSIAQVFGESVQTDIPAGTARLIVLVAGALSVNAASGILQALCGAAAPILALGAPRSSAPTRAPVVARIPGALPARAETIQAPSPSILEKNHGATLLLCPGLLASPYAVLAAGTSPSINISISMHDWVNSTDYIDQAILANVCANLMDVHIFETLRSKEQIGYVVSCSSTVIAGFPSLQLVVVSNHTAAPALAARIYRYLNEFASDVLAPLSKDEFVRQLDAICSSLIAPVSSLDEFVDGTWREITSRSRRFDLRSRIVARAAVLRSLPADGLSAWFSVARSWISAATISPHHLPPVSPSTPAPLLSSPKSCRFFYDE